MGAYFDEVAVFQDEDAVGADDAGESVGDDKSSPALHEAVEGFLDEGLVLGVDAGECLVEDKDRGVLEEGPGDGYTLALATGEPDGTLPLRRCRSPGEAGR